MEWKAHFDIDTTVLLIADDGESTILNMRENV